MDGVAGEAGREGLLVDGMSTGLSTAVGETVGPGWPSSLGVGPCWSSVECVGGRGIYCME